ncbi:hypothetical protein HZB03_05585 [Candidatus Woesearchaeota archaeon]|nr:hypothetical protein [Candidatus Woesearchaeota archaeon]
MRQRGWTGVVLVALIFLLMFLLQAVFVASELATPPERDGPQIDLTAPAVVFRGEPLTLDLLVTDISGVDSVEALLKLPDGETKSLHLRQDHYGDPAYYAKIPTTVTTKTGTYTFVIFVTDVYGNNAYAESKQLLTARYSLMFKADPLTVKGGEAVALSGLVLFDDGSLVPNAAVTLQTPAGKVSAPLDSNGMFSYLMTAPEKEGKYQVSVQVLSPDEQLFVASETIEVEASDVVNNMESDVGVTSAAGSEASMATDTAAASTAPLDSAYEESESVLQGSAVSASVEPSVEQAVVSPAESYDESALTSVSVASASAFFSLAGLSVGSTISGLVLLTILLAVLVGVGWKKDQPLSRKDLLHREMNTYLWKRWLQRESPNSRYLKK